MRRRQFITLAGGMVELPNGCIMGKTGDGCAGLFDRQPRATGESLKIGNAPSSSGASGCAFPRGASRSPTLK
jgi:hypothetical protein